MLKQKTRNVFLTPELEAFIDERVATGRYRSASEVVRAGLRRRAGQKTRYLPDGSTSRASLDHTD